ncbi:esterase family protein [Enterovibrio sp. ZSDZ42]|uniref:Esterase family protein n=1 Tax=Enterovibrio gelatinilyticus TaxID=2899819 RepID=A0ABT5QWD8_9GAMM|nr:alpha/beta hydrolase [Enterovibrio sp. ZSDZ42]MDD1792319.1 esterase family protein [Enterovibrio sp. ZSDZ42]
MTSDSTLKQKRENTYQGVVERFSFEAVTLVGNTSNENVLRNIIVYLPQSYADSPQREYPIVYLLHGMDSNPEAWFAPSANNPGIEQTMNRLVGAGEMGEMIIVAVDGTSSILGSWYLNSPISGNFFDYLTQEVIDITENRYRAIKGKRAICGHSMGGFGALNTIMMRPDLYQACAALSPGGMMMRDHGYQEHADFFRHQFDLFAKGEECEWFIHAYLTILRVIAPDSDNPPTYITRNINEAMLALEQFNLSATARDRAQFLNSQRKETLPIYTEIGTDEGESVGEPILENFKAMIATFTALGVPVSSHIFEGGHIDKVGEQTVRGLRFIDSKFN